jgi:hypothetical protein
VLGLPAGASPEEAEARYREGVRQHPPEADPEGFARLLRARQLLCDPEQVVARVFGRLHTLSPAAAGLPAKAAEAAPAARPQLALDAQLLIYSLLHALPDEAFQGAPGAAAKT